MRRKILMGVFAIALPIGTMAVLSPVATAAKPPPNPVSCTLNATVAISPPLSVTGVVAAKGTSGTTTVHVTYTNCTDAAGHTTLSGNTITITTPAGKDKNYKTDGNNKKLDYLGLCGAFASSSTTKDLGKAVKNLAVSGGILKGAKAAEGTVGTEVGFNIVNGTVKGGTFPTASHGASIAAGLVDTGSEGASNTNLVNGCTSGPVSTIYIDSSTSTATL